MRTRAWIVAAAFLTAAVSAREAAAQSEWTYRGRLTFETGATRAMSGWQWSTLTIGAADSSFEKGRLRLGLGVVAAGSTGGADWSVVAREAYARVSATSWLDLEVGKRLLRWGVGYGFAPTGVLDPPRPITDPTDRLGRQDGMPIARADVFMGGTSLTFAVAAPTTWRAGETTSAAPSRLIAARLRTVLPHGVEVAGIVSASDGRRASVGANVTHVVGQRLEWHGEMLVHDRGAVSAVAGVQYTLAGTNIVMEYHRRGSGPTMSARPGRAVFVRAARAGSDVTVSPEMIVIRDLDGHLWTAVAGVGWFVHPRLQVTTRATYVSSPVGLPAGSPRASRTFSIGATARF